MSDRETLIAAVKLVVVNLSLRKKCNPLALSDDELLVHMEMVLDGVGEKK